MYSLTALTSVILLFVSSSSCQTTQPGFGAAPTNSAALPRQTCVGQVLGNHCCPGRVLNQGSFGFANAICCIGDALGGIQNAVFASSCTSGTPTPLTALPSTNIPALKSLLTGTSTGPTPTGIGALPTGTTSRESNRAGGPANTGSGATSMAPSSSMSSAVQPATTAPSSTSSGGAARATALPVAGLLLGAMALL